MPSATCRLDPSGRMSAIVPGANSPPGKSKPTLFDVHVPAAVGRDVVPREAAERREVGVGGKRAVALAASTRPSRPTPAGAGRRAGSRCTSETTGRGRSPRAHRPGRARSPRPSPSRRTRGGRRASAATRETAGRPSRCAGEPSLPLQPHRPAPCLKRWLPAENDRKPPGLSGRRRSARDRCSQPTNRRIRSRPYPARPGRSRHRPDRCVRSTSR